MDIVELIRKKRFGGELTEQEIRYFISGVTDGSIPDYQISAMLMAICIRNMTDRETLALTLAMQHSGSCADLSPVDGIKADKHSTGGVGDTTSLVLVPLVACCGVRMAKMSGRGLGFTGGTLDKMESVPGMRTSLTMEEFLRQVREIGCAIIGQTEELAPADKVLYALRDVTGTVDCMPLIISSILSKKLAAGCDVVVLDVKYGSGGMAKDPEEAKLLAETMVRIGNLSGHSFSALVTGMEQPLGRYTGNALEVREAIEILSGGAEGDLKTVALELGAQILLRAGKADSAKQGREMLEAKIKDGSGLKKLAEMIRAQGGDPRVTEDPSLLPQAKKIRKVTALKDGYLAAVATDRVGTASNLLGAGRKKKTDTIDPSVGLILHKRLGDPVRKGDLLCEVHCGAGGDPDTAIQLLNNAFTVTKEQPAPVRLISYVVE